MFDLGIGDSPGCAAAIFYMALLAEGGRRASQFYKHGPPDGGPSPHLAQRGDNEGPSALRLEAVPRQLSDASTL